MLCNWQWLLIQGVVSRVRADVGRCAISILQSIIRTCGWVAPVTVRREQSLDVPHVGLNFRLAAAAFIAATFRLSSSNFLFSSPNCFSFSSLFANR